MVYLTKPQRKALKEIHQRPIAGPFPVQMSYRKFRKTVQPIFFCAGAVTINWAGMWLAIETDGYIHS